MWKEPVSSESAVVVVLQEVGGLGGWNDAFIVGHGVEDLEVLFEVRPNVQDGRHIAATVAVIGSAPHGDELLVELVLVSFLNELMSSADEFETVDLHELVRHASTKQPTRASRTHLPTTNIILRITPHEIAEGAIVGDLNVAVNHSNLIQSANIRREATMDTKNLVVDELDCRRMEVKGVGSVS